jgi:hypothetical protein
VRAAALVAGCLILATGCGSDGSSSDSGKAHSSVLKFDAGPGTSSVFVLGDRSKRVQAEEIYRVFDRPRQPSEHAIAERASEATEAACGADSVGGEEEGPSLGEPQAETVRILLRGVGKPPHDLVAMTTDHGAVALSLDPKSSTACGQPTVDGLLFAAELRKRDAIVYGLVGDDVRAVELVIDGVTRRAKLGENGFALEVSNPVGKTLEQVVLHNKDGSRTTFPGG